ncbi:MAG: enoyl-CoA hydratase-related protein [Actinomycetota bacterium]|nr:enoyl-CoA hydratase/isomerase family protein [Rubrobacter sp.]MDQ3860950.1 enoyl-CoA hydratase-related protein [Actinomycetota bacterium]MDQ5813250.1 enoyl-CoA hydratase-related protein [Actinomycetota bacterium]
MEEYETIVASVEEGVGRITINRPDSRNSLNTQVLGDIRQALAEFRHDESVNVVVFTGAGDRAFAAGADINELRERTMLDALASVMQAVYDEVEAFEKPTVAAVNGYALGGGCELAMACDIRIASENARFGQPEVALAILPGAGGTQRLARLIGKGRALEMIMTGRLMDAQEALSAGLVSKVVPQEDLMEAVGETVEQLLAKGPLAVRLAKLAVQAGYETDQRTGLLIERLAQAVLFTSEDKREGTSAFLEKREPEFGGR